MIAVNDTPTDFALSIVREHDPAPLHAPVHPVKVLEAEGVAVSITPVPVAKPAEQSAPQEIPRGDEVTTPVPVPEVVTATVL